MKTEKSLNVYKARQEEGHIRDQLKSRESM